MPLPTPPLAPSGAQASSPPGAQDDEISGPTLTSLRDHYQQQRTKIVVVVILVAVVTVLFVVFDSQILEALRPWKNFLIQAGVGGHAILAALVFVFSFPPLFGYSTVIIFAGYVFGLLGFLPCFVGAALGSAACYPLFRNSAQKWVNSAQQGDPKMRAVVSAVESRGFIMVLWIRFTPLSFCIVNMVLPSIPSLKFTSYFIATILSLPKLYVHIFIGMRFASLGDDRDPKSKLVNYAYLGLAGILGLGLCYYIYRVAWTKVEGTTDERSLADAETVVEPLPMYALPRQDAAGASDLDDAPPRPPDSAGVSASPYGGPPPPVVTANAPTSYNWLPTPPALSPLHSLDDVYNTTTPTPLDNDTAHLVS